MIFRIYDAQTGGNRLWSEQQTVTVSLGQFSVLLGQGTVSVYNSTPESRPPIDTVFSGGGIVTPSGPSRFLEIVVDDGNGTFTVADTPISPRQRITSTAYAFRAAQADTVTTGAINSVMILDGAIATVDLVNNAVTSDKILNNTITGDDIVKANPSGGSGTIEADHLKTDSVTSSKIAAGAVIAGKIANNAVNSGTIVDLSISTADLANSAVTSAKIADLTISTDDLQNGAVSTVKLNSSIGFFTKSGSNLTHTGSVGIGPTQPAVPLHVSSSAVKAMDDNHFFSLGGQIEIINGKNTYDMTLESHNGNTGIDWSGPNGY
jgi:hypothetical protein